MQLSFPGRQEPQKGTALPVSGSVINQHGIGSNSIDRKQVPYVLFPPPEADE